VNPRRPGNHTVEQRRGNGACRADAQPARHQRCEQTQDDKPCPLAEAPFALAHHPTRVDGAYVIAGHVHPCATLVGPGRQRERLPCFWLGRDAAVLPAFGDFTGCAEVEPEAGDETWVIAEDRVLLAARRDAFPPRGERSR